MVPRYGDVLVSHSTATIERQISIVPRTPHLVCSAHDTAVATGRELAERLQVDAWLTEDHTHYLPIASYRPAASVR